jgi:dTDP-glucose 4,6-dehydratase
MVLSKVMKGEVIQIHGQPRDIGSRNFIHARNVADAVLFLLRKPEAAAFPQQRRPDRWNVAGERLTNLELARQVAFAADRTLKYQLLDFHSARPGHDPHYSLDASKIAEAGWKAPVSFSEGLERTVAWTLQHPEWLA